LNRLNAAKAQDNIIFTNMHSSNPGMIEIRFVYFIEAKYPE